MQNDYIRLDKIDSMPNNPKDHDVGEIAASIERFGFVGSLVINTKTDHLVGGHGRVEALRWMKVKAYDKPRYINTDSSGMWNVPVDYVEVDENEEPALAIALNRLVEQGGWDNSKLLEQLDGLVVKGKEMLQGVGFDADDLDQIRTRLRFDSDSKDSDGSNGDLSAEEQVEGLQAGEEEQREIMEGAQTKYNVQQGDVWGIGWHRIICGDARDPNTWYELMNSAAEHNFLDGVFTSPPYANQRDEYYDSVEPISYNDWWNPIQESAFIYLKSNSSLFLNIKPNVEDGEKLLYVMDLIMAMKREWGWAFIDQFCWERPAPSGNWPNRFKNAWDSVYHFAPQPDITFYPDSVAEPRAGSTKGATNVNTGKYFNMHHGVEWSTSRPSNRLPTFGQVEGQGHPAAFPPALPAFFMVAYSLPGSVWLDPCVGSGSTMIAAADTNRVGYGMDILPEYVALTLQRMEAFTGTMAVKLSNTSSKEQDYENINGEEKSKENAASG